MDLKTSRIERIKDEMWDAVEIEKTSDILLGAMMIVEEIVEAAIDMCNYVERGELNL